ncbi:MAG: YncE family protein [Chlamydiia bacterium]|nr:YncE family protein [Chlamydiia bacterium]
MRKFLLILFVSLMGLANAKERILVQTPYETAVYDMESKKQLATFPGTYQSVALDQENGLVYLARGEVMPKDFRYITDLKGFDLKSNQIVMTFSFEKVGVPDNPYLLAVASKKQQAYLINNSSGELLVFDLSNKVQSDSIPLKGMPESIVISPDEKNLVAINSSSNSLSVISLDSHREYLTIPTEATPNHAVFSMDGRKIFFSQDNGTIVLFDLLFKRTIAKIPVGNNPKKLTMSPDGNTIYAVWEGAYGQKGVSIVDVKKNAKIGDSSCQLIMAGDPKDCVFNTDSTRAYCLVSLEYNTVITLDNDGVADCEPECIEVNFASYPGLPYYSIHLIHD